MAIEAFRSDEPDDLDTETGWGACWSDCETQFWGIQKFGFTPLNTNICPLKINGWKIKIPFETVPFLGTCEFWEGGRSNV